MNTTTPTDTKQNGAPAPVETPKPTAAIVPAGDHAEPSRTLSAFSNEANFSAGQRMAKALACSTLVPQAYQNNIPNVLIAMELANRIGASVLMVMQSLDVIHGRPSWQSKFLIATVNASGRFSPLRFRFQGKEGTPEWGCRAVAKDVKTGEECVGPLITIAMAKEEGWSTKNGSKWKTMPELMLCYRAAAFWTRLYAPEIGLGINTAEEAIDTTGYEIPASIAPGDAKALEAELLGTQPAADVVVTKDGEVTNG